MKAAEMAIMQVGRSPKQMLRREGGEGVQFYWEGDIFGKSAFSDIFIGPRSDHSLHMSVTH